MSSARRVKISVSLAPAVLDAVDRYAERAGVTRSAAMERWLLQSSQTDKRSRLEEETAAYYDSMTETERRDDAEWVAAVATSARKLDLDDRGATEGRRGARRRRKS